MRILMYSPIFPPAIGGPSTQCFNLCKALTEKREVPIVVTYGKNFSLKKDFGFKVYTFRLKYTYTPLDKAIRWFIYPVFFIYILKKERVDIIHCHSVSALSFVSGFIAKIFGIPSIIKFAGDWVWETLSTYKLQAKDFDEIYKKSVLTRFMFEVEKFGLNLFSKIWVVSEFRRKNIKRILGNDRKTFLINNCLLLQGGGSRHWETNDPVIVVSANRYIPHKRLPLMVGLFALMGIPNSQLILIGGGAKKEEDLIKKAIKEFNIENKVILKGILPLEKVYEEFKKASFYISTSFEEGLPNVFIEAMYYGLPIITSDAGGSSELVKNNETGFVVDMYNKADFVEKMKKLSINIPLREEMSKKSYERSQLFNLEYKIGEFITVYKSLLSK